MNGVERALAEAMIDETPPRRHGQLCPIWTRRMEAASTSPHSKRVRGGPPVCDCFIREDAIRWAPQVLRTFERRLAAMSMVGAP